MTSGARDWLPLDAFDDSTIDAALAGAVARWSGRWFEGPAISVVKSAVRKPGYRRTPIERAWRCFADSGFVDCSDKALSVVALRALDATSKIKTSAIADKKLLEAFGLAIVEDLFLTLRSTLKCPGESIATIDAIDPFAEMGGLELRLDSSPGMSAMIIGIPAGNLVARRKSPLTRQDPFVPGCNLLSAIEASSCTYQVALGHVNISAADLKALAVGDLLVLDTATKDPLEIISSASAASLCHGRLTADAAHFGLIACTLGE